ncbi:amidase [Altererythrobacter sp. BO-6]|uniref:amidase n=1 Tax=Altererythrobacter sp. BO-6 TaxID=2604537 RepID=UPI0013E156C4|nr:amidase [Altererythrobacter sp. BO-6]QIG53543.1 amidase [Altererythrobacter sp. BO-6]
MLDRFNAFLFRDDDARGGAGPLAGMTVGVKANIAVAGMRFHAGLGAWEGRRAERDAEVVRRLRDAGAAITGILNMEEAALGAKTDNPHFGPTHNPHRAGYSPGGSSGGSGAAVAARLCDVALGTDTMGSIRIPAAHCGIYGFKPATDRVSQDGLEPADYALDAVGPLARDLDTLEQVARVMSDFGEGAIEGAGATLADHGVELHPDVASAFAAACGALPRPVATASLSSPQSRIRYAGFIQVSKAMADHLHGVPTSDHLAKLLAYGPRRSTADWTEDQQVLARTAEEIHALVERNGFLILPTVPNAPFPHSEKEPAAQADFTCLANIAGLPALSLPMGWTGDGLPLGVQIVGAAGHEAGLFALARHLDDKLRAYRAPQLQGEP